MRHSARLRSGPSRPVSSRPAGSLALALALAAVAGVHPWAVAQGPPAPAPSPAPSRAPRVLVFGGDVSMTWRPIAPNAERLKPSQNPLRRVAPLWRDADLVTVNAEAVFLRTDPRYVARRWNLWAPRAAAQLFAMSGVTLVTTANNHALDGRPAGLLENLEALRATGVQVMGTGPTDEAARRAWVTGEGRQCVAIVPATTKLNKPPGDAAIAYYPLRRDRALRRKATGPKYQPEALVARVRALAARGCFVAVSIHWGQQYLVPPLPRMKRLAHALVDAGAGLIVGHHPHVLSALERYRGVLIAYSLGNLVFSNPAREMRRGALLRVVLGASAPAGSGSLSVTDARLLPLFIERRDYTPRPAGLGEAREIVRSLRGPSKRLGASLTLVELQADTRRAAEQEDDGAQAAAEILIGGADSEALGDAATSGGGASTGR